MQRRLCSFIHLVRDTQPPAKSAPQRLLFAVLGACLLSHTTATPLHTPDPSPGAYGIPQRRAEDADNTPSTMSPKIWIPIIVAGVILSAFAILCWSKGAIRRRVLRFNGAGAAGATVAAGGTRELTAEQLAGTINGEVIPGSGPTTRPRRARRARRASQISTKSLPAYNKEPGEEELVIFRGLDPEDASAMPAATVMNSVDEDHEEANNETRYSGMLTSANQADHPLLQGHDGNNTSVDLTQPPGEGMPRRSSDHSSHETTSLMRTESNSPPADTRGEAPPYFEVVDLNSNSGASVVRTPSTSVAPPQEPAHARRPSGFRNLLNRVSLVVNPYSQNTHHRTESSFSTTSTTFSRPSTSTNAHGTTTTTPAHHRPSPSSTSLLSSTSPSTTNLLRTISRQRSNHSLISNPNHHLSSPSMISLNSISAPLTHTAVRTGFTYPKSGPTPDQLKIISSRESVGRFGQPFGEDAVRYATQAPPDFATATRLRGYASSAELQSVQRGGGGLGRPRSATEMALREGGGQGQQGSGLGGQRVRERAGTTNVPSMLRPSTAPEVSPPRRTRRLEAEEEEGGAQVVLIPPTPSYPPLPGSSSATTSEFGFGGAQSGSGTMSSMRSGSGASVLSYATAVESLGDAQEYDGSPPATPKIGVHPLEGTDATVVPGGGRRV